MRSENFYDDTSKRSAKEIGDFRFRRILFRGGWGRGDKTIAGGGEREIGAARCGGYETEKLPRFEEAEDLIWERGLTDAGC